YNKILADVKFIVQVAETVYDNCADRDRVESILVATYETELKEFLEKNKGNRAG
ncbi:hypothetical protein KI387_018818, partial [Taxus chinensis]